MYINTGVVYRLKGSCVVGGLVYILYFLAVLGMLDQWRDSGQRGTFQFTSLQNGMGCVMLGWMQRNFPISRKC